MTKNNWLLDHKKNITSQFGEDGILEKIFSLINDKNKWCVEFGAWDGKKNSNTCDLINNGWNSIMIESNKTKYKELKNNFKNNEQVICLNIFVDFDGENTLDNILSKTVIPTDFDLLSIDIDGNDYHIWDSVKKYEPKVVVIEYNPTIPDDIDFIQEKNINVNNGNSLLSITNLAKAKGYELICATEGSAFFVKNKYYNIFNIENNSIKEINTETEKYKMKLFQLYDGTLVLRGCDKLLWKNIKIDQEKIQVLPKNLRFFADGASNTKAKIYRKIQPIISKLLKNRKY